ncbi:MAG: TonB-dependent receptor, partial [Pseudomonadales bacterium]
MSNKTITRKRSGWVDAPTIKRSTGLAAAVSIVTGISGTTWAQQLELEETVVTAQKRSQSIQDVPIAMQAYSSDQMRAMSVQKASDITRMAPNINISGNSPANQQINIRGVGTNDFFGNATGAVGIYMDEVTMSAPYLTGIGIYDLERVEVLRGPQNSLFGRNTTGGAVNYISKMPVVGGDSDSFVSATLGNHNQFETEVGVSFSLSDSSAIRLSGKTYQRDGIWNNLSNNGDDFGEKDRYSLRANFVWEPSDKTSVIVNLHSADEDSEFDPIRSVGTRIEQGIPENGPLPTSRLPDQVDFTTNYNTFNNQGDNPSTTDWEDVYVDSEQVYELEAIGGYLKVIHEFDWATFSSITSWDDTETRWSYGAGGNANPGNTTDLATFTEENLGGPAATAQNVLSISQDQEYTQYSQELRFSSSDDATFDWVAGLYYFYEESDLSQNIGFGLSALNFGGPPAGGSLGLWVFNDMTNIYSQQTAFSIAELENTVWSPYIHTEFPLTDRMNLTVGLRYTEDEKKVPSLLIGNYDNSVQPSSTFWDKDLVLQQAAGAPLCDFDGDGNIFGVTQTADNRGQVCTQDIGGSDQDLTFKEWGGKLGLNYIFNDDVMVYGSFSRGFRSGKHDIEFLHGPHTGFKRQNVDVEVLDAFEIGTKTTLLDGALQLNAAAFYYIWEDQQIFFVGPNGPEFANIDESELTGLEVEFQWSPAEGWFLSGGIGLMDTEVTESSDEGAAEEGHELAFSADSSANLMVLKEIPLGNGRLTLQADYQYQSAPKAYYTTRQ